MGEEPSRREFLKWTAGTLTGLGLAPVLPAGARAGEEARFGGYAGDGALPPRTVALRSLGGDFVFDPAGLTLEPGTRLTWLNMGDFHTATAFHPDNDDLLSSEVPLRIPDRAEPWHSGMLGLDGGTEFSYTFEVSGVYDYFCQPHYSFGMVGRVVVPSADGATPDARPASDLNEASRKQMPSVDSILSAAGRAYGWTARINGVLLLRAHGDAAAGPAERLAEGLADDRQLSDLLERAGVKGWALSSLEGFVDAVRSDAGYETLVDRADQAKAPLTEAAESVA